MRKDSPIKQEEGKAQIKGHSPRFLRKQQFRTSSFDTYFLFLSFSQLKSTSGFRFRIW